MVIMVLGVYFAVSFKCKVSEGSLYQFLGDRVSHLCILLEQENTNDSSMAPSTTGTTGADGGDHGARADPGEVGTAITVTGVLSYSTSLFYTNILSSFSALTTSLFDQLGWDKSWMDVGYFTCYSQILLRMLIPAVILKLFSLVGFRRQGVLLFLLLIITSFYKVIATFFANFVMVSLLLGTYAGDALLSLLSLPSLYVYTHSLLYSLHSPLSPLCSHSPLSIISDPWLLILNMLFHRS